MPGIYTPLPCSGHANLKSYLTMRVALCQPATLAGRCLAPTAPPAPTRSWSTKRQRRQGSLPLRLGAGQVSCAECSAEVGLAVAPSCFRRKPHRLPLSCCRLAPAAAAEASALSSSSVPAAAPPSTAPAHARWACGISTWCISGSACSQFAWRRHSMEAGLSYVLPSPPVAVLSCTCTCNDLFL